MSHQQYHSSKTEWKDGAGRVWRIRDMSDGHLCNTIRMLGRWFFEVQSGHDFIGYSGGFAARGPASLFPVYKYMFREALRRGLMP